MTSIGAASADAATLQKASRGQTVGLGLRPPNSASTASRNAPAVLSAEHVDAGSVEEIERVLQFLPEPVKRHLGLLQLAERAHAVGGRNAGKQRPFEVELGEDLLRLGGDEIIKERPGFRSEEHT